MNVSHNRCPYTLQPLSSLEEVNLEHIFPDAIGGLRDYAVDVDKNANSTLGSKVDAPLIESFLMAGLRLRHGIKSRSGAPKLRVTGTLRGTERKVQLVLDEDGGCEVHIRNPVEMSADGKSGKLLLLPEQRDKFLSDFIENHQRKNRKVVVTAQSNTDRAEVEVPIEFDFMALKRAMMKIAFLAVFECVGDSFLDDPLIPEWHKSFSAKNPDESKNAKIYGIAFDADKIIALAIPPLKPYEHAVFVANLQMRGPVVGVTLFGTGFHSLVAIASETSLHGLGDGEGKITICDTKARKSRSIPFMQHLIDNADLGSWASQ